MFNVKVGWFFLLFVFLLVPVSTQAQFLGNLSGVHIALTPEHPRPHQSVEARVHSATVNVSSATIIWLVNEEIVQQGPGETSFVFEAPALGETLHVTVLVQAADEQVFSDTITIHPTEVVLLWEAETFTPPFYRGRALYTSGSSIRAEARATIIDENGRIYPSEELTYTWRRNDSVLGSHSGLGKNTLVIEGPKFFSDDILSVEARTKDGVLTASAAVLIATNEPQVLLYEEDPLIGTTYHRAIETGHAFRDSAQVSLQAVPLFMDALRPNDARLLYTWNVNSTDVEPNTNEPSLVNFSFNAPEDFSTNAQIVVEHVTHLLQAAKNEWLFHFEGGARATPFGR